MRGQVGKDNVVVHSQRERRYRCLCCGHSFSERRGTPFYRLRAQEETVTLVVALLAYGCPRQAIVAAFGLDERTVAAWQRRAGTHCEQVHQAVVQQGQVDLQVVQADELWVKAVGRRLWLAMALALPSHLWLGGGISAARNAALLERLALQIRRCAHTLGFLVCVDGLATYVEVCRRTFREARRTGQRGRPRLRLAPDFLLGQVHKVREKRRVVGVAPRPVIGTLEAIRARLRAARAGQQLNTAFIERLNATFRSRLAALVRRGRCLARQEHTLHTGLYLVGSVYNFCTYHDRLRLPQPGARRKWLPRTPAMAAGLTAQRWSVWELLHYRVAPPPWEAPRRRGPKPRQPRGIPWKLRANRFAYPSTL